MVFTRVGFLVPLVVAGCYAVLIGRIPVHMFGDPLGPRAFPYVIVGLLCLAASFWLVESLAARRAGPPNIEAQPSVPAKPWLAPAVMLWFLLYTTAIAEIGFVIATGLFLGGLLMSFNPTRWRTNLALVVAVPLVTHLLFTNVLAIALPKGSLLPL